jgi:ribonuclease D
MSDLPQEIVETPAALKACCAHLAERPAFGFDTEFIGEDSYHPHLCLVQVASDQRLFIIDPLSVGPLDCFWHVVADTAKTVVVHAGREEIRMCKLWGGHVPTHLFDLQLAAGLVGLGYPVGHAALVNHYLGVQLAKAETLTDWARRPLTPAQVKYAFDDVRFLLPLWKVLAKKLDDLDRADWAAEEFEALARRAVLENPAVERWRKLRGVGSLDRRKLAVVRELYAWREELAARANRPPRTIVRDDLLVEIARRNPKSERDLVVLRGLPRHDPAPILEAVQRGRDTPPDELPTVAERDNDPPQVALVTSFLLAVLADHCARRFLTPGLVATNHDVKLLVRARHQGAPLPEESVLTRGWRGRHVLPELQAVLDGRQAVKVENPRAAAPLARVDLLPPAPEARP